jgi:hypothetical protein
MPNLQPILKLLDKSIRATIPGLHYAVKWKRPFYGLPQSGWIIEIAAYDVSVNVVVLGGGDFDRPPPLGTTGRTRYLKVATVEEAQRPELHAWIEEAARQPGWSSITSPHLDWLVGPAGTASRPPWPGSEACGKPRMGGGRWSVAPSAAAAEVLGHGVGDPDPRTPPSGSPSGAGCAAPPSPSRPAARGLRPRRVAGPGTGFAGHPRSL